MTDTHRDPKVEEMIERFGAQWELVEVAPGDINWSPSKNHQTRTTVFDTDQLEHLRGLVAEGQVFPAGIGVRGEEGLEVVAGFHRGMAHEEAEVDWALYVVTGAEETELYYMALEDNSRHGLPLTKVDRARHAARLIDEMGLSVRDAAEKLGAAVSTVGRELNVIRFDARATKAGIDKGCGLERLAASSKFRLAQCTSRFDDEVFKAVVGAAISAGASTGNCQILSSRVAKCTSVDDVIDALALFTEEFSVPKSKNTDARSPRVPTEARRVAWEFLELDSDRLLDQVRPKEVGPLVALMARVEARAADLGALLKMEGPV